RGTTFTTTYTYHHGYFDRIERDFRGFGRVEQIDVESFGAFARANAASPFVTDETLFQPPVKTVTWFRLGAFEHESTTPALYEDEFFPRGLDWAASTAKLVQGVFAERRLPDLEFAQPRLPADDWREALRACTGMILRQEVYELDVAALTEGRHEPVKLISAAFHNCRIDCLQPRRSNRHGVFLVTESEALAYHYDLDLRPATITPDPRVEHRLNLKVDRAGRLLQSAAVAYGRAESFSDASIDATTVARIVEAQRRTHLHY